MNFAETFEEHGNHGEKGSQDIGKKGGESSPARLPVAIERIARRYRSRI
jgi:hypothetical protein